VAVSAATTDTGGNYVLALPPGTLVHVVPSTAGLVFVPSYRSYGNLTASLTNENYLVVTTAQPSLTSQLQSNSLILSWYGIPGVIYQPLYSTNLVDWGAYPGGNQLGTNGPLQLAVPIGTDPKKFFRVEATY
jgi:hypothetical protein